MGTQDLSQPKKTMSHVWSCPELSRAWGIVGGLEVPSSSETYTLRSFPGWAEMDRRQNSFPALCRGYSAGEVETAWHLPL